MLNRPSKRKRSAPLDWQSFVAPTWCPALLMDRHPQTPARDSETARLEVLALPQPWQQAQVSADRQAEVQESDCKALQLALVDLALLAVVGRLDSLLLGFPQLVSLLPASVDLPQARLASHLPLAAVDSLPGDRT